MAWYVYVLETADGTFYTGITSDLERRETQHNAGRGAKYTAVRRPVKIIAAWEAQNRSHALKLEYAFKQLTRLAKTQIISNAEASWHDAPRCR